MLRIRASTPRKKRGMFGACANQVRALPRLRPERKPQWEGWDDAAVAPEKLGGYLRDIRKLLDEYDYTGAFYGHYRARLHPHARELRFRKRDGDSQLWRVRRTRRRPGGELRRLAFRRAWRRAIARRAAAENVWSGVDERLPRIQGRLGPRQQSQSAQGGRCPLANRRSAAGRGLQTARAETHFKFLGDDGSFANAAVRCIGVGACRKHDTGSMCPSYMATLEEEHSTRGRAHMLFEMLQGEVIERRLEERGREEVARSVPLLQGLQVGVPRQRRLATYKAEFLSHYYEGRRPAAARLRLRHDRPMGRARFDRAAASRIFSAGAGLPIRSCAGRLGLAPQRADAVDLRRQLSSSGPGSIAFPIATEKAGTDQRRRPTTREVILVGGHL